MPGAVKRKVSTRLDGFHPPTIYTYPLESTLAEKFDAIIKRMEAASRMKDFFDIYYRSGVFDFEGRKLQEAIFVHLSIGVLFMNRIVLNESEISVATHPC